MRQQSYDSNVALPRKQFWNGIHLPEVRRLIETVSLDYRIARVFEIETLTISERNRREGLQTFKASFRTSINTFLFTKLQQIPFKAVPDLMEMLILRS